MSGQTLAVVWEALFYDGLLRIFNNAGDIAPLNIAGHRLCPPSPIIWGRDGGTFFNDNEIWHYCDEMPAQYSILSDRRQLFTVQYEGSADCPPGYREDGLVVVIRRGKLRISL